MEAAHIFPSFEQLIRNPPNNAIPGLRLEQEEEKWYQHYPTFKVRPLGRWIPAAQLQRMRFLYLIRRWRDLDPKLPAPQSPQGNNRLYDVYALTKADLTPRGTIQSMLHWSIYCAGYVYHLGADSVSGGTGPLTCLAEDDPKFPRFKIDECLIGTDEQSISFASRHQKPLVAYHIGQTDLHYEQIKLIGDWLIGQMGSYDFVRSNCQHFLLILAMRIICRRRRFTVFIGTLVQIARWDNAFRQNRPRDHNDGFQNGFLIRAPQDPYHARSGSWLAMFLEQAKVEGLVWHIDRLWPAVGSENPPPRHVTQYSWIARQLLMFPSLRKLIVRKDDREEFQPLWTEVDAG